MALRPPRTNRPLPRSIKVTVLPRAAPHATERPLWCRAQALGKSSTRVHIEPYLRVSVADPLDLDDEDEDEDEAVGRVSEEGDQSLAVGAEWQGAQGSCWFARAALVFGRIDDDHGIHELREGSPRGLA